MVTTHTFRHPMFFFFFLTDRGVIVVSVVFGGGEVCIVYTLVLVNLLDPKHVLGYLYEYHSVD